MNILNNAIGINALDGVHRVIEYLQSECDRNNVHRNFLHMFHTRYTKL